jgi:hypothetical protein
MVEQLMGKIVKTINRRRFLRRAAWACSAVATAILGFAKRAEATFTYACCNLCTSTMCQSLSQCAGTWCWTCNYKINIDGHGYCYVYRCYECYNSSAPTDCFSACNVRAMCIPGACNNIICSLGQIGGTCE